METSGHMKLACFSYFEVFAICFHCVIYFLQTMSVLKVTKKITNISGKGNYHKLLFFKSIINYEFTNHLFKVIDY